MSEPTHLELRAEIEILKNALADTNQRLIASERRAADRTRAFVDEVDRMRSRFDARQDAIARELGARIEALEAQAQFQRQTNVEKR